MMLWWVVGSGSPRGALGSAARWAAIAVQSWQPLRPPAQVFSAKTEVTQVGVKI